MAKKKGRTLLIKIGDGADPEVYSTLCGLNSKTLTINNSEVDVTTPDCVDPDGVLWTEVLDGVKRVSVSGNGFFEDSASELRLNTVVMATPPVASLQVIVPGLGTFQGEFFVSDVEWGGESEGGVTGSLSAASTGAIAFTAA